MNILFTCVGKRVELVEAFRASSEHTGIDVILWGADSSKTAPALFYCNHSVQMPRIDSENYISELLRICEEQAIDAVIPTIDTDLLLLAQNQEQFTATQTQVVVSGEQCIQICRDKRKTAGFFTECGLKTPKTVDNIQAYDGGYPAFIKPLNGSSSTNAFIVHTQDDLTMYTRSIEGYIIQPYIEGREFTVDILCDLSGRALRITPRERLAVRAGEVIKTRITYDERMISDCLRLVERLKPRGAITVQLIRETTTGDDYYIEINPRFGGGAPLSMLAGADAASALLRVLKGTTVVPNFGLARDGAIFSRFDQSTCVEFGAACAVDAVIFDLDDTLYSERTYVRSGFTAVAAQLPEINDAFARLWSAFENGYAAIDTVLEEVGLPERKEECLRVYRHHAPNIELYPEVIEVIRQLKACGVKIGLITDGRPEGQRAKIRALGLDSMMDEIIITDDLGGSQFRKPCDIAFRIMQRRWGVPCAKILYVGDNPKKDFAAPMQLGMQWVWLHNPDGLYAGISGCEDQRIEKLCEVLRWS